MRGGWKGETFREKAADGKRENWKRNRNKASLHVPLNKILRGGYTKREGFGIIKFKEAALGKRAAIVFYVSGGFLPQKAFWAEQGAAPERNCFFYIKCASNVQCAKNIQCVLSV